MVIGLPVLVLGIILIPLPGPGILVSFLGLYILSSEFDAAKPYRDKIKKKLQKLINTAKTKQEEIDKKYK